VQEAERLNLLARVLRAAAQAPGNSARFDSAGLLDDSGGLCADWQAGFARLSVLRKDDLRSQPGAFLSNASDVVYRGKTSGTTSGALTYFAGKAWNDKRIEARQRTQEWWELGEVPVVNVASRLGPVGLQDSSLVGLVDYGFLETLLQIVGEGPVILRGYPSRLCEVAIALRRHQLRLPADSVRAVIATGERLFEVQRSLLFDTFGVSIINEYGCQESGISGMSCPEAGRIHLDEDRCLYEVMDGELVTTDLWNTTLPMVRYVSGDVLALYSDPCPCGRAGLTAKILGRDKQSGSGEIELPAFPGVLNYQIKVEGSQRIVWVQPEKSIAEETTLPLREWFEDTFGAGKTEVLIDSPFASFSQSAGCTSESLNRPSCETWLQQVTQRQWADWIEQPLPGGDAANIAALLQQMVLPNQAVGRGVSQQVLRLIRAVKLSPLTANARLEVMKLRVLFWSLSLMTELEDSAEIRCCYDEVIQRFERWQRYAYGAAHGAAHGDAYGAAHEALPSCGVHLSAFSALGFDILAPLLTLESGAERWDSIVQKVRECWPNGIQKDRFSIHHYLTVLDIAGQNAQRKGHTWTPTLRPLSALLLGDFYRVVSSLSVADVALWIEIVHEQALVSEACEVTFESQRRAFRRSLLKKEKTKSLECLASLFECADTDRKVAQCWLEKSYASLLFEEEMEPQMWVAVLREQIGLLRQGDQPVSNPVAWSPLLKALAPKLISAGRHELAYACLFAAAPPNRKASSFDRLSASVNSKQPAISVTSATQ